MKRVMLFLVVSAISSTTLFSMDEKQRLQQLDCSLERIMKQANELTSLIQQGSDLTEDERALVYGEYDQSKADKFLAEIDRQLNLMPTEQEVDDVLKYKEMRELVDDMVNHAFTQSADINKIIDEFKIVEVEDE